MDIERLRRLPLFGELDHHDLAQLMRWVREEEVADGDLLFEQGSMPHDIFVIEEGSVEVVRDGKSIATLGPGEVVGERALLKFERRWASVVAFSDTARLGRTSSRPSISIPETRPAVDTVMRRAEKSMPRESVRIRIERTTLA